MNLTCKSDFSRLEELHNKTARVSPRFRWELQLQNVSAQILIFRNRLQHLLHVGRVDQHILFL